MLPSIDTSRYADLFRIEAHEHLAELESALLRLEQGGASAPNDGHGDRRDADRQDGLATLFRATHTIKGMAASMGYRAVERLSHGLESLLDRVREGKLALSPDVVALLFDGADTLKQAVANTALGVDDPDDESVRAMLQRLEQTNAADALAATSVEDLFGSIVTIDDGVRLGSAGFEDAVGGGADDAALGATRAGARRAVSVTLTRECQLKGVRALLVLGRLEGLGKIHDVAPPQERWHHDGFEGVFTLVLECTALPEDIEAAARAAGDVATVDVRADEQRSPERARETLRHVRIDLRRLDTLLDLMGELVIARDRLLRETESAVEQGADRGLSRVAHEMSRLLGSLQDEVLQARMVPVGQVFDRFPRLVRDVSRELGKDVQFVMEGREIELDRSLLEAIGDPIMHLLRNALDHGLEDAETRRAAGKPPTGRLVLRAARDRASVVIQVEDNGRGIDRDAVLQRAVAKGLIGRHEFDGAENASGFDDDRLLQTLAHSGLSTALSVTAISGRGVGVDVVATRVRALGGLLSLETIKDVGTVFTMRLPATLAITRALLVRVADATYAIPAAHVVEALEYDPAMGMEREGREELRVREEILPVLRLRQRFGYPAGDGEGYVAIVEASGRRCALVVDGMIAQQDVVVKPFDAVRGGAPWFSGATVLGDGTPSLIVDLGSLI
jgi:two-component system chemotaxis sensor kinase CheA